MLMSIQNEMPGYNEMNQYLNQQGTGLTPAEMHGLISGMICGGNDDGSWLPLLHDLTNEGMAFGHEPGTGTAQNALCHQRCPAG